MRINYAVVVKAKQIQFITTVVYFQVCKRLQKLLPLVNYGNTTGYDSFHSFLKFQFFKPCFKGSGNGTFQYFLPCWCHLAVEVHTYLHNYTYMSSSVDVITYVSLYLKLSTNFKLKFSSLTKFFNSFAKVSTKKKTFSIGIQLLRKICMNESIFYLQIPLKLISIFLFSR